MPCPHIRPTGFEEYSCAITGASVDLDCGDFTGERCAPMLALDVRDGRLTLDEIMRPMDKAVRSVLIQLGELEPEVPPLPLGKPRSYVARNRRRRQGKGKWKWSAEQRARLGETKRKWWAQRKAAR